MWRKEEEQAARPAPATTAASPEPTRAPAVRSAQATIGPSIVIHGEVSGSEDLLIQGRIDGSISLGSHAVTVGGGGQVNADISGRVITVEGDVEGDLTAEEQIVLRGSAKVLGDITAPRVVLEDGATFRGLVDMGTPRERGKAAAGAKETGKGGGSATSGGQAASGSEGSKSGSSASPSQGSQAQGSTGGQTGAGAGGRSAGERKTGS